MANQITFSVAGNNPIKRNGAVYSGTADWVKVYASDPRITKQDPLAEWGSTAITAGELTVTETGIVSGSLNALSTGVDYHFNIGKAALDGQNALNVYGVIQVTEL